MKKIKTVYWISTAILYAFDSLIPAFTFNTELAKQGISHLGYPDYFRIELSIFKIIGGLLIILPMVKPRYKEWAYVGFGITFISAIIGHWCVDGFGRDVFIALIVFAIMLVSYFSYHKILATGGWKTQKPY